MGPLQLIKLLTSMIVAVLSAMQDLDDSSSPSAPGTDDVVPPGWTPKFLVEHLAVPGLHSLGEPVPAPGVEVPTARWETGPPPTFSLSDHPIHSWALNMS